MQHEQASEQPPHVDGNDMMMPGAEDSENRSIVNQGSQIVWGGTESRRRDYRRQSSLTPHADFVEDEIEGVGEMSSQNYSDAVEDILDNHTDVNRSDGGGNDGDEGFDDADDAVHYEYIHLHDNEADNASADQPSNSDDEFGNENDIPDNYLGPLQPAKNHSYLPTAQPLYPEKWVSSGKHIQRLSDSIVEENADAHANEYATCGVSTNGIAANEDNDALPLHFNIPEPPGGLHCRTSTTSANIYDEEMSSSTECITMAVLEMDDSIVLFPGAVLPLRLRDQKWVSYLGALIDDARGLYGTHQNTMEGMGEVSLVIMPRVPIGTRRTRRTPVEGRGRTGRWQVNLIRLGATVMRRHARRRRTPDSIENNSDDRPNRMEDEEGGDTHGDIEQPPSDGEIDGDELFHPMHQVATPDDPLTGRIGTLATVAFTHEETTTSWTNSSPSVWRNRAGELILTVLGTQRCRLIRSAKDEKQDRIPLYVIEEVHDGSSALPPSWMLQLPGNVRSPISTPKVETSRVKNDGIEHSDTGLSSRVEIYNAAIQKLSHRTRTPAIAYCALWPWRLCQKVLDLIRNTEEFQGLREILPSANGLCCDLNGGNQPSGRAAIQVVDPSAFANWVAANMPLSVNDRLDLLEMACTVQQLKYILRKMEAKRIERILRCMNCGSAISQMRHVFSVGGSDGTTGAYVNEYGVVHQTMTLRQVDGNVACAGRPETRDSWFPGYCWQIANCSVCSAHLGWKFRKVSKGDDFDPDRPETFWGLSSLTTEKHVKPRRVIFSPGRNLVALLQLG